MLHFCLVFLFVALQADAAPSFRYIPEHVFTMDVALICQSGQERLNMSAVISIWEHDTSKFRFGFLCFGIFGTDSQMPNFLIIKIRL